MIKIMDKFEGKLRHQYFKIVNTPTGSNITIEGEPVLENEYDKIVSVRKNVRFGNYISNALILCYKGNSFNVIFDGKVMPNTYINHDMFSIAEAKFIYFTRVDGGITFLNLDKSKVIDSNLDNIFFYKDDTHKTYKLITYKDKKTIIYTVDSKFNVDFNQPLVILNSIYDICNIFITKNLDLTFIIKDKHKGKFGLVVLDVDTHNCTSIVEPNIVGSMLKYNDKVIIMVQNNEDDTSVITIYDYEGNLLSTINLEGYILSMVLEDKLTVELLNENIHVKRYEVN